MGWKGSLLLIWAHAALPGPQVEQNCFYGCMCCSTAICLYREVAAISIHQAMCDSVCWWKNSFASYSAATFVDGEARLLDVIYFSLWSDKELARSLLTLGKRVLMKMSVSKNAFVNCMLNI